jgi:hypothetical protein
MDSYTDDLAKVVKAVICGRRYRPSFPASPDRSPVKHYGGDAQATARQAHETKPACALPRHAHTSWAVPRHAHTSWALKDTGLWCLGCDCFAF